MAAPNPVFSKGNARHHWIVNFFGDGGVLGFSVFRLTNVQNATKLGKQVPTPYPTFTETGSFL